MRLIGRDLLEKASQKYADARDWVEVWAAAVEFADWQSPDDVHNTFPSADGLKMPSGTIVTVFKVRGNRYRLIAEISYATRTVEVLEVLTLSNYSRNLWKVRY